MAKPDADQLAALEELRRLDPALEIEWDEETGTPKFIRGVLSRPVAPNAAFTVEEQAPESALAFLVQNRALYQFSDPRAEFPRRRMISDEHGNTVHLYQVYQGIEVLDGELSVALDAQNQVTQVMGRYRRSLDLSTTPTLSADEAVHRALADLNVEDKELAPITQRLLIASPRSLAVASADGAILAWRIDLQDWVYFVDAHEGKVLLAYDNKQTARNRETFSTANCRLLPGTLWVNESGPVAGQPVDQIALSAHQHAGSVYDYFMAHFGLDSVDGKGLRLVSTVHSGINNGFTCDHNNAAFLPSLRQIVYGDGDGVRFGPFAYALDVVAHEWQHAVTYFTITWSDGSPRGLDYRDESGALNESYSDLFGALVEGRDWFLGEDCYTPNTPDDALRDMANPALHGQPDHYSNYVNTGTQSYRVHINSGIMNKAAYLMCEGGSHRGVSVSAIGKEATARIWYRALKHHLQGTSNFVAARSAFLQACQELYPGDAAKYTAVQNACAAVGVGQAAAPSPNIAVDPARLDFGSVTIGKTTKSNLNIQNTGNAELSVSAIELPAGPFSTSGESTFRLAAGVSRSVAVSFSPVEPGTQRVDLVIRSNVQARPSLTVPLSGSAAGVPTIVVEPLLLNFGSVVLGQTKQLSVTVRNSGSVDLVVSDIHTDLSTFAISGETAFQLPPNGSKTVAVRFGPLTVGTQEATLTMVSNDPVHGTLNLDLLGEGHGVPLIWVEPLSLDFGQVLLGQSSQRTVTVRNQGSLMLVISRVHVDRAVFAPSGDPSFALAPGASQTLAIRFSPAAVGPVEATLILDSNDTSKPTISMPLAGMGVAAPYITAEPNPVDLGSVAVGHSSQGTLTVRNIGTADLSVSAMDLAPGPFLISGDTAFTLAPAGSRQVMVHFTPSQAGAAQTGLTIHSSDQDRPSLLVGLVGLAVTLPQISVDPATAAFGSVMIGQSAERSLTIRNSGTKELIVSAISLSAGEFSLRGETAFRLEPTAVKTLIVSFTPTTVGAKQASLIIQSNDADRPLLSVELQAEGLGVPYMQVDPSRIDFGPVDIGQSANRSLVIRNNGSAALSVSIAKPVAGPFSLTGGAEFVLAPAGSREVLLTYAPATAKPHQDTLWIRSNDPDQPSLSVPLAGSGVGVPQVRVEPTQLDFGTVRPAQTAQRTLMLHNVGTADLSVSAIDISNGPFRLVSATTFVLTPGSTQTVTVEFASQQIGLLQASLTIHSNDADQPAWTVSLTGQCVGAPRIALLPTQMEFGPIALGQLVQQDLSIHNAGSADLTVSTLELPEGPFSLSGETGFVVTPTASRDVPVNYRPQAPGLHTAVLTVRSDDPTQPSLTLRLSGSGVAVAAISVEPSALDFGSVNLGESQVRNLLVHSSGSAELVVSGMELPPGPFVCPSEVPFAVPPGSSRSVTITYVPATAGAAQATLTIRSNDAARPGLTVSLSGAGTAVARISVQPASLDFGSVNLGRTVERELSVTNTGSAELFADRIEFSHQGFALDGETSFRLAPTVSRILRIRFTALAVGPAEAAMTIFSSAAAQPALQVPLSAVVAGIPKIAAEPTIVSFGAVRVGESANAALTVRNSGSAELRISSMDLATGPFSLTGDKDFRLAPAESRKLTLVFSPAEAGQHEALLIIHSDDSTQAALNVPLEGVAVGVPQIAAEPAQLEWGTLSLGPPAERSLTLRNPGSADLLVSAAQCDHPAFSVSGATVFALAPQTSRALPVAFSPHAAGSFQATLMIQSNAQNSPMLQVVLLAKVAGLSDIRVEPAQVDFGAVLLGQSAQKTLTVTNAGTGDLTVSNISLPAGPFLLSGDAAFTLPPNGIQKVTISFGPEALGPHQTTLTIHSTDPDQPAWSVALSGSGIGLPQIQVAPQTLDFGTVKLGDSTQQTLTLSNVGTATLTITAIDCPMGPFSVVGSRAYDLPPGTLREMAVSYTPSEAIAHQDKLTIQSSDPDRPAIEVYMQGAGVGVPQIAVEPASLDFGTTVLGQSTERSLAITNLGTANLLVMSIDVSGGEFGLEDDSAFVLRPAVSRTVSVKFRPSAPGVQHCTLSIRSNDAEQPQCVITVQGACVGIPSVVVDPTSLDFGEVELGQQPRMGVTIRNAGSADLRVADVRCDHLAFLVEGQLSFSLAPGSQRSLTVGFVPSVSGPYESRLIIRCDDPKTPTVLVDLTATAIGVPLLTVEPRQLEWGTVPVEQSVERSLTLRNPGSADLFVSAIECDHPAFSVSGTTVFTLAPQADQRISVAIKADSPGRLRATLTIQSNARGQPSVDVPLSATSAGESDLRVEPAQIDFGSVLLGNTAQSTLSVHNAGTGDLTVSAIQISEGPFHLPASTTFTLAPGNSHEVIVFFSPEAIGARQATLSLYSSDPDQPVWNLVVSGSGVGMPRLEVEPHVLDFGATSLGQSPQRTLILRNVGSDVLAVSAIQSSQPAFSVAGQGRFSLEPGAQHDTLVRFTALTTGLQQGTVTIFSNDTSQPEFVVTASGVVAEGPKIVTEPTSLDFGTVAPGSSTGLSLTIRNLGGTVLQVTDITVKGSAPSSSAGSFQILGNAVFDLLPGDFSVVALRFAPDTQGVQRAALSIQSNDPRWPALPVDMVGACEASLPQGPYILLEPQQLDFGSVPLGQSSQRDLVLRNAGTDSLRVARTTIDRSVFAVASEDTLLLQPSESRRLTLQYKPTASGADRGRLTLFSNDAQHAEATVNLYGACTNCAAATATYGSPLQKDLPTLRALRDQTLVRSPLGRLAVRAYYFCSPAIASWIASSAGRRTVVRAALRPMVALARLLMVRTDYTVGELGSTPRHSRRGR